MHSFTGHHSVTMDSKGRITLPARWRRVLSGYAEGADKELNLFITADFQHKALRIYPEKEYDALAAPFDNMPQYSRDTELPRTVFYSHCREVSLMLSAGGRLLVLLDEIICQHAEIERGSKLTLVGSGRYASLWLPKNYDALATLEQPLIPDDVLEKYSLGVVNPCPNDEQSRT